MDLADKMKALRKQVGEKNGRQRPLTQAELAQAIHAQTGTSISQGYLSQLENGKRTHLTSKTRNQLATFFGVHPGYLVSDPEPPSGIATAGAPHLPHPFEHHTLAKIGAHPHRSHLWALLNVLMELPADDLEDLHVLLSARVRK
ncbi:MAG: helix-turn-helix transcriptional regulator [Ktedonobacterales bacterium]|nr:helix-turn-helix transcriptional regulator [Ktedonobacterales bacterium]